MINFSRNPAASGFARVFYKKEVVEYYSFTVCIFRLFLFVVNSVCQREKALVGICSPKQTKPLASNCRCACARQLWRSRRGSRKARQFCLFAGTANLVVIVTTGMQVCRKQTGTRRIFLPH